MKTKAKQIIKDKFWIVEQEGKSIGTLAWDDERYIFTDSTKIEFFNNKQQVEKKFGTGILTFDISDFSKDQSDYSVNGYTTKTQPYNTLYDVKKKLPLFTKSEKSKCVYCAGYYLIKFNVTWLRSFCPKLITIERNEYLGPFRTEFEMKQELKIANK